MYYFLCLFRILLPSFPSFTPFLYPFILSVFHFQDFLFYLILSPLHDLFNLFLSSFTYFHNFCPSSARAFFLSSFLSLIHVFLLALFKFFLYSFSFILFSSLLLTSSVFFLYPVSPFPLFLSFLLIPSLFQYSFLSRSID